MLQHEDPMAELGAVCLSAAVEAQLALSGAALRAARSQVPQQVPPLARGCLRPSGLDGWGGPGEV